MLHKPTKSSQIEYPEAVSILSGRSYHGYYRAIISLDSTVLHNKLLKNERYGTQETQKNCLTIQGEHAIFSAS